MQTWPTWWSQPIRPGASLGLCTLTELVHNPKNGSSVVWKARHPLKQIVAVKLVKPDVAEAFQERGDLSLRQEIRILRLLEKFGVMPGYFVEGECLTHPRYLAVNWLAGITLGTLLDTVSWCGWNELRPTIAALCAQLAPLHTAGFVHRDIKPDNVMLARPHATLFDFGLCVATSRIQDKVNPASPPMDSASPGGSLRYCPPEQFDDQTPASAATDIYSMGCLIYHALTGEPPFQGRTFEELEALHLTGVPAQINPHSPVPVELTRTIMACLEKTPAHRPGLSEVAALCGTNLWRQTKNRRQDVLAGGFAFSNPVISCRGPGLCRRHSAQ